MNVPSSKGTDKASIAVLPFTNIRADPEQTYFSDGITEDILTELSRFRPLSVVARGDCYLRWFRRSSTAGEDAALSPCGVGSHLKLFIISRSCQPQCGHVMMESSSMAPIRNYHLRNRCPTAAPRSARAPIASVYHVATNSGESSVQCAA